MNGQCLSCGCMGGTRNYCSQLYNDGMFLKILASEHGLPFNFNSFVFILYIYSIYHLNHQIYSH